MHAQFSGRIGRVQRRGRADRRQIGGHSTSYSLQAAKTLESLQFHICTTVPIPSYNADDLGRFRGEYYPHPSLHNALILPPSSPA